MKLTYVLSLATLLFALNTPLAYAVSDYVPLAPLPLTTYETAGSNTGCGTGEGTKTNLCLYLKGAFRLGIAIAGVLAVLVLISGGLQYMSTDAIGGKTEARGRIQNAIGGLVLALASYLILYTINPSLVELNLNFGPALRPSTPGSFGMPREYRELESYRGQQTVRTVLEDRENFAKRVASGELTGARQADEDHRITQKEKAAFNMIEVNKTADNLRTTLAGNLNNSVFQPSYSEVQRSVNMAISERDRLTRDFRNRTDELRAVGATSDAEVLEKQMVENLKPLNDLIQKGSKCSDRAYYNTHLAECKV